MPHMEEVKGPIHIDNSGSRAGGLARGELHDAPGGGHEAGDGDRLVLPAMLLIAVPRIRRGPGWIHAAPAEGFGQLPPLLSRYHIAQPLHGQERKRSMQTVLPPWRYVGALQAALVLLLLTKKPGEPFLMHF